LAEREVGRLHEEIQTLTLRIEALEQDKVELSDAASASDRRALDWQQRYRQDIPSGEAKTLYELTQRKLQDGVGPERLSFVMEQARNRENCSEEVETRRFYVKTPLYHGANDTVGFGNRAITVTAQGTESVDAAGNAQAQFDPAQPVVVRFAQLGGATSETSGLLPLHHAVVMGDWEYRFSIVAGAPGMMMVTGGRCSYP
jgi:hypothetical protein